MELKTNLGMLKVTPATEPGYPGFYISLVRPDGNQFTPVLVEVNETTSDARLKVYQWSDEDYWGDPETIHNYTPKRIDNIFKEAV